MLGRPKYRWKDNRKMAVKEIECERAAGFIWLGIWTGGGLL
jgi:hypothetical protein